MQRFNYNHLHYFWIVAKEGSVSRASEKLHVTQPTVSTQIAQFEAAVGQKLFERVGRGLSLTDTGRGVFEYAEEIFALGRELTQFLNGRSVGRGSRLSVGIAEALPKLMVTRLLEPALRGPEPIHLTCHEDKSERLLVDLSVHALDMVLSDVPATPHSGVGFFNHLLVESEVSVFGTPELVQRYGAIMPQSLNGAPVLLPSANQSLRRVLDQWFDSEGIWPDVRAEIADSALLKTFGSQGAGLFLAPSLVSEAICRQYGVENAGTLPGVHERFYLITAQRKIQHPTIVAILAQSRRFPVTGAAEATSNHGGDY
jgi:LysR family transcriptional activator of nhaA